MKIGIVTFHFVPNSGAVLQCWALQETLKKLGHSVEVINYQPDYHTKRYSPFKNPVVESGGSLITFIRVLYYNRNAITRKKRLASYKSFCKILNCTEIIKDLDCINNINITTFDAIICGSDQIWNQYITNGDFDPCYFAKIPGFTGRKVAYAASIGETDLNKNKETLKELINDFHAISLREENDSKKLENVISRNVNTVPDPTILLPSQEYESLMANISLKEEYILVYGFGNEKLFIDTLASVINKYKCTVINISPYKLPKSIKNTWIKEVDPAHFLAYIYNAKFVITNSFHCTVFSILFHKEFCTVRHKSRNSRIENLLDKMGLKDNLVYSLEDLNSLLISHIDYAKVEENILAQRTDGLNFLKQSLQE